jgi:hypothetical protein
MIKMFTRNNIVIVAGRFLNPLRQHMQYKIHNRVSPVIRKISKKKQQQQQNKQTNTS